MGLLSTEDSRYLTKDQADDLYDPLGTAAKIYVSGNDSTAGYLADKLIAGDDMTLTEVNDGADEDLRVNAKRYLGIAPFESSAAVTVGNGEVAIPISEDLNGFDITDVLVTVHDKGITGTTDVQIRRRRAGVDSDVLTTKVTLGDEFYASDGLVDSGNDDLATGDVLYVDVDAIHSGTAPNGMSVVITVEN